MEIIRNKIALKDAIRRLTAVGKTIGLVPTMGALHAGHLSLVNIAQRHADAVVATIFVNPTQFGPNEDFTRYPRNEEADTMQLAQAGVQIVYIPSVEEMYEGDPRTVVSVGDIANALCGAFRPGHFDAVATVVTKLFMQVMPDIAVFGEKDYQQLHIIRTFTHDLDIPVSIIGGAVIREADGLALSSRNRYLSETQRRAAASLYRALTQAAQAIKAGQEVAAALTDAKDALMASGFSRIDYIELRDAATLAPAATLKQPARLLAAAYLGTTRLIDNIAVEI